MKKLITLLLLVLCTGAFAQQYNNEWIDYTKTHYKFKVAENGLYRISQATLSEAGLGATPVQQFRLFRNGQEVALSSPVSAGPLPSNGYIEFYGVKNDGRADKPLYANPASQHSDKLSLQTDTAAYFLTVNAGANLRATVVPNNVSGNSLPAEQYFLYTTGFNFRSKINHGFSRVVGEYVYSSSYDKGEYWSTNDIVPGNNYSDVLNNLFVHATGPAATIKYGASGNAQNSRTLKVLVNSSLIKETVIQNFNDIVESVTFPVSVLASNSARIEFSNGSAVTTDRMVVSFLEMTYPRLFNFGNSRNFEFELPAKSAGYFLDIADFNTGGQPPLLYDLGYHEIYTGEVSGNRVRFALPGSANARKLVLVSTEASNIKNVGKLTVKNFVNFRDATNQSDYLIISNPLLYNGTNGVNFVEEYRKYRSSAAGGNYKAGIYEIDELVDQFAFGIKKHPLSIKNFLRFARATFSTAPTNVFLIGRGVSYNEYNYNQSNPVADQLNLVPSFGYPASDNLLSSPDALSATPVTPIGRLSVINAKELEDYLEKVKEYEHAQQTAPSTIQGRLWMKNIIHVTGASDSYLGTVLCSYMEGYKRIIEDTLAGASVTVFCKSSTSEVEQLSSEKIAEMFQEGLSLVTYFGHSSSTTLEFNLDNPQNYNNPGKYPVFSVNGCNAGNFFTFDPQRFTFNETLSEKFVLAKQRGGIAFIASTHFGIVNYLNIYINEMYADISRTRFGATLGEINKDALKKVVDVAGKDDFFARLHAEEVTLHGDPALKMNFDVQTDYIIEEPQVKISPSFISIAANEFDLGVKMYNLGKAVKDSITIEVKRQYPDGTTDVLYRKKSRGIYYSDSLNLKVPVIGTRDKGLNKIIVTIDADNVVSEKSETNNTITKDIFIYEDEARPAYPYDLSIVNSSSQKVFASTADPFSRQKQYAMEMDTTELFNSSLKVAKNITSIGGLIEFDPGIQYRDSTVYYWRTSLVPESGGEYRWNNASFLFLKDGSAGFGQSHYFQHLKSNASQLSLNENRSWNFGSRTNNLFIRNAIYPTSGIEDSEFSVSVNGESYIMSACVGLSLIFHVFDPVTFKPWKNVDSEGRNLHLSGSGDANCSGTRNYNFEFSNMLPEDRLKIMKFMDSIPAGYYVAVKNVPSSEESVNTYANTWEADTSLFGPSRSLYHSLKTSGLPIDSFNRARAFAFVYQKGNPAFTPSYKFSEGIYDRVLLAVDCPTPDTLGFITSPKFGPAKSWRQLVWKGVNAEENSADNPSLDVIGINAAGMESPLFTLDKNTHEFDISSVDAKQFPFLQLRMRNVDAVTLTPYQLQYWRLYYDPIPEGALAPNLFLTAKDSLEVGENLNFGIAFKNMSPAGFDSLKVRVSIIDKDNVSHPVELPKQKPLPAGDTLKLLQVINTKDYPEMNTLYVEFNPGGDQPEQYQYNNFLYRNFYVKPDLTNPLMDVTFDGVHILNRDIVSAKPRIQIKLKDEARFLLLNDTSLMTVQVRIPDQSNTLRTYRFDNDTLRFIPAQSSSDNTATIEFTPAFTEQFNPDGDDYELIVRGKDISGNKAGNLEYRVTFRVINKPMISNLLNYPNPFTTSTAFVFTITGDQVPQNMKIQILTITGKIVREVTIDELGPLRIGRNITEFKWDGTDQFGQRLANGVYLYRVVTTLNGRQMDKYKAEGDETDKFFNRGYGKMYLMR